MKIPGYSNWFTVFRPLRWLVPLAEQAYDVAGIFLAADTPLPDETVRLLQRIAGEIGEIRDLLEQQMPVSPSNHVSYNVTTSAPRRLLHSPKPEDAAEGPPPIASDSVSGGGHPKTEIRECICGRRFEVITADAKPWTVCPHCMKTEIPDEYWDGALK